ncbi:hypothetical protein DMC25_11780 [Caulobacter sp. D4A]|uniref:hypothetical protein n=1 Tax=Caulobacter sp. D4A TaxID=2204171 RepID=UPI000D72968C|nr:hypothetical protein [Caulobacter sp. D4A]PXA88010.1 hypothetical protein DMC25_11780 [Caulobacter sp. D4A]
MTTGTPAASLGYFATLRSRDEPPDETSLLPPLAIVAIFLSLVLVVFVEAVGFGAFSPLWIRPIVRATCAANLLVALAGLMTVRHATWINYLLLSITTYIVASTTPIAALWVIPRAMLLTVIYAFSSLW